MRGWRPLCILSILCIIMSTISCGKDNMVNQDLNSIVIEISFKSLIEETKSISIEENRIESLNLYITNEIGQVIYQNYYNGLPSSLKTELWRGERYEFYAIANCGKEIKCSTKKDIIEIAHEIDTPNEIAINSSALMSGTAVVNNAQENGSIDIILQRCYSKINVQLDTTKLSEGVFYKITKIQLKNSPKKISIFSDNTLSDPAYFMDGDCCDDEKLKRIDTTPISLYQYENIQGTLSDNTNPKSKLPNSELKEKTCSYLEVQAKYTSITSSGIIKYKLFLGNDIFSNFNVKRNKTYNITIIPIDDGRDENDWRIDESQLFDTDLSLWSIIPNKTSLTTFQGFNDTITYSIYPPELSNHPIEIEYNGDPKCLEIIDKNKIVVRGGEQIGGGNIYLGFKDIPNATKGVIEHTNVKSINGDHDTLYITYDIKNRIPSRYQPFIKGSDSNKIVFNTFKNCKYTIRILEDDYQKAFELHEDNTIKAKDSLGIFHAIGTIKGENNVLYSDTLTINVNTIINIMEELRYNYKEPFSNGNGYMYYYGRYYKYYIYEYNRFLRGIPVQKPAIKDLPIVLRAHPNVSPIDPDIELGKYDKAPVGSYVWSSYFENSSRAEYCVQVKQENILVKTIYGVTIPVLLISDGAFRGKQI